MIICGIASLPQRVDSLKRVLDAIAPQVNIVHVALNGHSELPSWHSEFSNVYFNFTKNELGDAHKFTWADKYDAWYLALDDDLVVPPFYAEYMVGKCKEHNCPVSLHGKRYNYPVADYHRSIYQNFHCRNTIEGDHKVDVIGTGVCCFNTSDIKISIDDFKTPNMADLWFALSAHNQGVPLMVVEHMAGWLDYTNPDWTIWRNRKRDGKETEIINEILRPNQ